jgi:zinc-ribbon domain
MALIKCRECGHEISKKAKTCPNCGGKVKKTGFFLKLLIAFGVLVMLAEVSKGLPQKPPPTPEEQAAEAVFQKASMGAISLRENMRNPKSFELLKVYVVSDTKAVCYQYRAENGFGGVNVESAVLAQDGVTFKSNSMEGFSELWQRDCQSGQPAEDYTGRVKVALRFN